MTYAARVQTYAQPAPVAYATLAQSPVAERILGTLMGRPEELQELQATMLRIGSQTLSRQAFDELLQECCAKVGCTVQEFNVFLQLFGQPAFQPFGEQVH